MNHAQTEKWFELNIFRQVSTSTRLINRRQYEIKRERNRSFGDIWLWLIKPLTLKIKQDAWGSWLMNKSNHCNDWVEVQFTHKKVAVFLFVTDNIFVSRSCKGLYRSHMLRPCKHSSIFAHFWPFMLLHPNWLSHKPFAEQIRQSLWKRYPCNWPNNRITSELYQ